MSEFDEDPSASTQQFRAFAERVEADNAHSPSPWHMRAPASRVLLLTAAVIAVAVVVGAIALSVAG